MNHKTKDRCQLKFVPYSYFSKEAARKVTRVTAWNPVGPEQTVCLCVLPTSAGDWSGERQPGQGPLRAVRFLG